MVPWSLSCKQLDWYTGARILETFGVLYPRLYRIRQNVHGGNFRGFSLNCKSFPVNHGLFDRQYKSTKLKLYRKRLFPTQNAKVFRKPQLKPDPIPQLGAYQSEIISARGNSLFPRALIISNR